MTTVQYYRRAIWMPFLLPLLALPEFLRNYPIQWSIVVLPTDFSFALLLVRSLAYGGLPYLILLAFHWRLMRAGTDAMWSEFILTAPWKMLFPMIPGTVFINALADSTSYCNNGVDGHCSPDLALYLLVYLIAAVTTIILGYIYVVLIQAQLWLLQRIGWVRPQAFIADFDVMPPAR